MNGKKKYLLAVSFLTLIGFCAYFWSALEAVHNALLHEKYIEKKLDIDLICDEIDLLIALDNDWGEYDYETIISSVTAQLDAIPGTYAELFDENLDSISARSPTYESAPFVPASYPEFVSAANGNESGDIVLEFEAPGVTARDMYVYYRWVPTDSTLSGRMLVVAGISRYSVNTKIAEWITYGAAVLIVTASVYILGSVVLLCYLGHIYEKRGGGTKWRSKISS